MLKFADGPLSISSIVVSLWLAGCLAKSTLIGWRKYYGGGGVGVDRHLCGAQQTRGFDPMLFQYWPPQPTALDQYWNNIRSSPRVSWESCLHFDTRMSSVSGWNMLHNALCSPYYGESDRPRPVMDRCLTKIAHHHSVSVINLRLTPQGQSRSKVNMLLYVHGEVFVQMNNRNHIAPSCLL